MNPHIIDVKARIKNKLPDLTHSQKLIANYLIENPEIFALSSIRDLESTLNTSKTTIVRLAQTLGYSGFQELKGEFLDTMRKELDPIHRFKSRLNHDDIEGDMIGQVTDQTLNNINLTLDYFNKADFDRALEMIKNASYVYSMGMAISSHLAEITAYLFSRVSLKANALTYGALNFSEQIINMTQDDLIIAFSFPPYSEPTIKAAEYAQENNLKVLSITDKPTSQIVQHSDLFLQVSVKSVTMANSIMAPLVLIYALASQIGLDNKQKTIQTIESIDHVRKEH
ncbi:MurR/RpiR family transcriptional regulator [bacterium]|nr:MurR/RpiR family transcriptional regulator [bacterium]